MWTARMILASVIALLMAGVCGNVANAGPCAGRPSNAKIATSFVAILHDTTTEAVPAYSVKAVVGSDCTNLRILFSSNDGHLKTFFYAARLVHADDGKWYLLYPEQEGRGDAAEVK